MVSRKRISSIWNRAKGSRLTVQSMLPLHYAAQRCYQTSGAWIRTKGFPSKAGCFLTNYTASQPTSCVVEGMRGASGRLSASEPFIPQRGRTELTATVKLLELLSLLQTLCCLVDISSALISLFGDQLLELNVQPYNLRGRMVRLSQIGPLTYFFHQVCITGSSSILPLSSLGPPHFQISIPYHLQGQPRLAILHHSLKPFLHFVVRFGLSNTNRLTFVTSENCREDANEFHLAHLLTRTIARTSRPGKICSFRKGFDLCSDGILRALGGWG